MKLNTSKTPFIPEGFTLLSHEDNGEIEITKDSFVLHLEPEQKYGFIEGDVLAKRMKGKGLNANVLDFLLENKELIPEEWKGRFVSFWGTIYLHSSSDLCVRYLYWGGDRWDWGYDWLDHDWSDGNPALCLASPQSSALSTSSDTSSLSTLEEAIALVKKEGYKVIREV